MPTTRAVSSRDPLALATQPAFDPLARAIAQAHDAGLQVHAWVNVNLVAGVGELPAARDHVIYRHPEWLMVPRALAEDLAAIDPKSPEYLGRLARYVRGQPNDSRGCISRRSPTAPSSTRRTSCATSRSATRSMACTSTTSATRLKSSTTAATRSPHSARTSAPISSTADQQKYDRAAGAGAVHLHGGVSRTVACVPHRPADAVWSSRCATP